MTAKTRIKQLETRKPKPKEHTAQVVIYKVGEPVKTTAANVTIFIPDNERDKVTV
jgi:hypothetical protein